MASRGWITLRHAATTFIWPSARLRPFDPSEGESERPEANAPIVRGDTAVKDIGTVVDFILKRRNIARLNLLGWSWGTTLMATYTTGHADKVERLML